MNDTPTSAPARLFQRHPPRRAIIFREKAFWLLTLLGMLYFSPVLLFGKTFFFRDLYLHFFFRKHLLAQCLHSGQWPLWNSFFHGGRPYWGDLSNALLHPSNILYACLPTITAFNLIIVCHFLLAGAAMYWCARSLGLTPVSSLIAGLIFEFCGYTLSLGNMLGFLLALPYMPPLLLGWHRYLQTARRRWLLLALVCGMIQVFAGAPELSVLSLFIVLGWTISFPYPHFSRKRRIGLWIGLSVSLVGLTAIQLLPTLEMIAFSSRGAGIPYQAFTQWSLHPKRLPELIFPGLLGFLDQFPWDVYYWGKHLTDLDYPYVISLYFGGITLVLAGLAVCKGSPAIFHPESLAGEATQAENTPNANLPQRLLDHPDRIPLPVRRTLFGLAFCSLLLAFGRFLPGFSWFYTYVPLVSIFRYPVKFFMASILPIALLAAYTVDDLFSGRNVRRISRKILIGVSVIATLLLLFAGLFHISDSVATAFMRFWFGDVTIAVARHNLLRTFWHAAAIWALFTILLSACRRERQTWQPWFLAGIVAVDLLIAGNRLNPYAPKEFFTAVPETVARIQQERGTGRLYRTKNPAQITLPHLPSADIMWGDRWNLETLNSSLAAIYDIPLIFHVDYDRLAHQRIATLSALLDVLPWERRLPIVSAGNVTVILTTDRIAVPGIRLLGEVPNRSTTPFYLYKNTLSAGRVEFVSYWQHVSSDSEALGALLDTDYDPGTRVILQKAFDSTWLAAFTNPVLPLSARIEIVPPTGQSANISGTTCQPARITATSRTATYARLAVANACDGYLVFAEPFYPGWQIRVDGEKVPIVQANYAFSAISLAAGEHQIERLYHPTAVYVGAGVSLVFCGLLALYMFLSKKT